MSKREQATWVALVTEALVAWYYFTSLQGFADPLDIYSVEMAGLIIKVIVISIALAIGGEIVLSVASRDVKDKVDADERDYMIDAKATRNAYYAVVVGVALLIGQIAVGEGWQMGLAERNIQITPILAAHILLALLIFAGFVKYGTRLFYYRRGY